MDPNTVKVMKMGSARRGFSLYLPPFRVEQKRFLIMCGSKPNIWVQLWFKVIRILMSWICLLRKTANEVRFVQVCFQRKSKRKPKKTYNLEQELCKKLHHSLDSIMEQDAPVLAGKGMLCVSLLAHRLPTSTTRRSPRAIYFFLQQRTTCSFHELARQRMEIFFGLREGSVPSQ